MFKMWRKFFGTAALTFMLCLTGLVMPGTAFAQQLTENECWSMDYCEIAVDYFDRIVKKYGNKMEYQAFRRSMSKNSIRIRLHMQNNKRFSWYSGDRKAA